LLGKDIRAFRLYDSIGRRRCCTLCFSVQIHEDVNILIAETLKAIAKGCHYGIRQLGGNSLLDRRCNLFRGRKTGALQRQPFGGRSSVNTRRHLPGSDKLI
jgi:hypothetical protein